MLTESIRYLKESDDVWKTSIIGGVLLLLGFLVLPLFLVWGYVVRVVDRTARGDEEAPVFEEWGALTVDGAKTFVIMVAYGLVPVVVGTAVIGGAVLSTGGEPGAVGAAGIVLGTILTFVLFVAAAYAFPAAVAHFAEERRLGAGFDVETLRPVLTSGTYAVRWLLSAGIVLAGSIVVGALNVVPYVGIPLGAVVTFYALVSAYSVIGRTWGELHPVSIERGGDLPSERPAA